MAADQPLDLASLRMAVRALADDAPSLPTLRHAFADSSLPFSVDVLEMRDASATVLSRIDAGGRLPWCGEGDE